MSGSPFSVKGVWHPLQSWMVTRYLPRSTGSTAGAAAGAAWPAAGNGYALVGDAAVSFDPLSSRGITGALLSGMHVGQAIHAELLGERQELQRYAATIARVYADHQRVQAAYYRMERRYQDHPFWARRASAIIDGS